MSLQGRLERAHAAEVEALKGQLGQRTWDLGVAEEAKCKLAEELEQEKERARARDEELVAQNRRVEELKLEVEKVRKDFVASDTEVARLQAQLDIVGRELEESENKVGRMNGMCRRQVGRMLKGQRSAFRKACRKQSRRAAKVVRGYLESRRPWSRVDKLVSQAEEAERILLRLRSDGVPIPEDKLASVVAAKEKYSLERSSIRQKTLSAEDFEFVVPSDLGVPNLDQMDFSAVFAFGEEDEEYWGGSTDEGDQDDEEEDEGEEDGEEEEEEEEEEEYVPLAAKGATSGVRSEVEGSQLLPEADGSGLDAEAGEVTREARGGAGEILPEGDGVPTTAEGDRVEATPLAGETIPPPIEGAVAGDRSRDDAEPGGEKTPPAAEGDASGVRDNVQLAGDGIPPASGE